jgi:hypothetical protein
MDITFFKDIATIIGGLILLLTFLKTTVEYIRQGTHKRVELFLQLDDRFQHNKNFQLIRNYIQTKNPKISQVNKKMRSDYAGYFEQIALLTNSGVLKKEVACYMFSDDAIQCWECEEFWKDFDKSDSYWGLLRKFVEDMKAIRNKLKPSKNKLRL